MKLRRLEQEKKEREEREKLVVQGILTHKYHMTYIHSYPGITPTDLNGRAPCFTECEARLWGTKYVYPLWQAQWEPHPVLVAPYCLGCCRLFSFPNPSMKEKLAIIRWLVYRVHEDLDYNSSPANGLDFVNRAEGMKKRAARMRKVLYDHPTWEYLKGRMKIFFEIKFGNPSLGDFQAQQLADKFIKETQGIIIIEPTPIDQIEMPTPEELRQLVVQRDARDAMINHKCSAKPHSEIHLTFDHIEPA